MDCFRFVGKFPILFFHSSNFGEPFLVLTRCEHDSRILRGHICSRSAVLEVVFSDGRSGQFDTWFELES